MGLTSTAAAASGSVKPTGGVAKRAQGSTSTAFYAVPSGKYFVGFVGSARDTAGININGSKMFYNDDSGDEGNNSHGPLTFYAGTTFAPGNSNYYSWVAGVEYDL